MSALVRRVLEATREQFGYVPEFRLRPGASSQLLAAVESEIGYALPRELSELYLSHDGQDAKGVGLFFGWVFDPLSVCLANWRLEREAYGERRSDWARCAADERATTTGRRRVQPSISSPRWFPISSLSGRTGLYADSDPARDGLEGQIIVAGNEVLDPDSFADSLTQFFATMESMIRQDKVSLGRDADRRKTWGIGPAVGGIDEFRELFVGLGSDWVSRVDAACA